MENVITIQAVSTVNKSYLLQTNVSVLSLRELYSFMADEFSKNGFTCYDLCLFFSLDAI